MSAHTPRYESDPDATVVRPATGRSATPGRPRRRRTPVVLAVLGTVVVLLGALYVVGYLMAGDKLPKQARISGVAVGGLSRAQANAKLAGELGGRAAQPIAVTANGKGGQVEPARAGLRIDYARSVAEAGGGKSFDPRQILRVLTGGSSTEVVVVVDKQQLVQEMRALAKTVDQRPADAAVAYAGAAVDRTPGRPGVTLQQEAAATAVEQSFLTSTAVDLPVDVVEPAVTTAEADRVVAGFAEPAVSGPVKVTTGGGGAFAVTPGMIAGAISFAVKDGTITHRLDADQLRSNADPAVKRVDLTKPRDARVRLVNGKPQVIPAVNGTAVGAAELARAIEPVLTKAGADRTAEVKLTGADADFSTADARKLGIQQVTGEFTTYFPYLAYRNINIGRAAELINGTVLKPGETFSLNKIVGERTKANGFTEGFIIKGGKFKKELGGGVSQSATTTYNAMFFAGLKDIQHQPHTLYIDRYPPGREATVAWPTLDLQFQNDTQYGVLVQAYLVKATNNRRGSLTVKMWSTKTYDKVNSTTPQKSGFTTGKDLKDSSASCEPMSPVPGFDADYQRLFYRAGQVVKRESFHWRYAPTDKVTCTEPRQPGRR